MEFVRLPIGQQANVDADCIRLEEQPGGAWMLTASALCVGTDEGSSVSIVAAPLFDSVADAEAAGVAWAEDVGVATLVISRGTLQQPLETLEIDKPL